MPKRRSASVLVVMSLVSAMTLGACARQISPDVHSGPAAGQAQRTEAGVIENVRLVEIQESDTLEGNKTGQVLGGLAGGVAGARFGQGVGKALASAGGAILGAFIGSFAEQEVKRQQAFEYIVRTDSGQLLTIVQGLEPQMTPGQRVYIQEGGRGRGRVIPAI